MENKVYCLLFPNGKRYIGMTRNIKDRCRPSHYKKQKVYNAIKKYGWHSIQVLILSDKVNRENAKREEIKYIKLYKTANSSFGYNEDIGVKHSKQHIEDSINHRRSYLKEQNPFYKHTHKKETINKIISNRRSYKGKNNPRAKKIRCVNNNKIYSTINEASLDLAISKPMIIGVLNGKYKSTKGYRFEEII